MPLLIGPDLEAAVIAGLKATAAWTAVVPAGRLATRLPTDPTLPYVTVRQMGGRAPATVWVDGSLFQFEVWAASSAQASQVARTLRATLQELHNTTQAGVVLSVDARSTPFSMPDDSYTPARDRYILEADIVGHTSPA